MTLFANLNNDGLEEARDSLGGFAAKESGLYNAVIKLAYAAPAASGAMGIALVFGLEDGSEYRETLYVTNKKGENWYANKNDASKKVPLPGFTIVDDLCMLTTEMPLSAQATEEKTIKVYDSEAKKELPKAVQMLTELLGKQVILGILKKVENKTVKEGNEYVPTNEKRELNSIDKVFHYELRLTVVEARNGEEVGKFIDSWNERNAGNTRDSFKEVTDTGAPRSAPKPGAAPAAGGKPRPSLFKK